MCKQVTVCIPLLCNNLISIYSKIIKVHLASDYYVHICKTLCLHLFNMRSLSEFQETVTEFKYFFITYHVTV